MKTRFFQEICLAIFSATVFVARAQDASAPQLPEPVSVTQICAIADRQFPGDGISVTAVPGGGRLRCVPQRLEGEVTTEGLWLRSTIGDATGDRFRVMAVCLGRRDSLFFASPFEETKDLPALGAVQVAGDAVRFTRAGLIEEFTVSLDGVRQDFLIEKRPGGEGELRLRLDVIGAVVEPLANSGVLLTLPDSGRKLNYHRLQVTDSQGRELSARLEASKPNGLEVVVQDAEAVYPVRVDPTFSDADWVSLNGLPGADDTVSAVAFDGSGNLYIGGSFFTVGNIVTRRIAKWDGNNWSDLDKGLNGPVNAIVVSGNDVYVGGAFSTAEDGDFNNGIIISVNNIARWNGNDWQPLDVGVGGTVYSLALSGSDLYAGGTFSTAGLVAARRVAKWDGSAWSALGVGIGVVSSQVNALAVSGGDLYAAGTFGQLGDGTIMSRIARWNGSTWSAVGGGIGGGTSPSVNALAVVGTDLYAAGVFTIAGSVSPANNLVKWNGSAWAAVGGGLNGSALALAASGSDLYVGGAFTMAGTNPVNRIAKWDGNAWSTPGTGASAQVNALAVSGNRLAAGGAFTVRPGVRVGEWNGSEWSALGSGLRNPISALAVSGNDIYAGGSFAITGVDTANNIARWNSSAWSGLAGGLNGGVSALLASGTDLYVGGSFTTATNTGGATVAVNRIAKWNGSVWSALDVGVNSNISALAMIGSDLFVGGRFTMAGGAAAFGIAKWNGSAWSAVGEGLNATVNGSVNALAATGNDLYAAGVFTTATNAGGVALTVNRIARWNGSAWSALGSGMNIDVNALAIKDSILYAGGLFSTAGGVPVGRIAQWDGNVWSVLGSATNNIFVYSLTVAGNDLYVGGTFNTVGGNVPANNIAKWDGTNWTALGSGLNGTTFPSANAMAAMGGQLYVGGSFYMAGDKASQYFAKANISGLPLPGRFTGLSYSPVTGFSCTFLDAAVGQSYRIQFSSSLSPVNWVDLTNFTYTGPTGISDSSAGLGTNRFFRAVTP